MHHVRPARHEFLSELSAITAIQHINFVRLLSYCTSGTSSCSTPTAGAFPGAWAAIDDGDSTGILGEPRVRSRGDEGDLHVVLVKAQVESDDKFISPEK
ncbi:hypothetical protein QJS04_geneDACA000309 [Acorus gramineus]|uniref:Serine-threonine/tyrosine-protein kinase catalytic domain-containing protein n=1 Tax=Acorus gramineus TaxID=55184 RepID=A0AAV9AS91_ACOGR|nr:hypothetical protein QJS04_geneDACA000309 [Acorus gramineus]